MRLRPCLGMLAAVVALSGCQKKPSTPCAQGQTAPCTCGEAQGTQVCNDDGAGFGACQCADTTCGGAGCATMPDLVGKSVADAASALRSVGLRLPDPLDPSGFIVEREVHDPPVVVLEQTPAAGEPLALGTTPVLRVIIPPDQEFLGLPRSHFLVGLLTQDDTASAQAYYDAIDPPPGNRTTLDAWKSANRFGQPADEEAQVTYMSGPDLGIVRVMRMQREGPRVAFFSENYPTFADAAAQTGRLGVDAMELSPPSNDPTGRPFAKFFTFDGNGQRVTATALDSRGNRMQPGVCRACHGGDLSDRTYADGGDTKSHFIPFDLDAMRFPQIAGLTRADQEAEFKKLNRAVQLTYLDDDPEYPTSDPPPARALIDGWYGGAGLPSSHFDGSFVPGGWDAGVDVYQAVIGPSCRGCHYQLDPARNFSSYEKLWGQQSVVWQRVFEDGDMPMSEKGALSFWLSAPSRSESLASWMQKPVLSAPGRPIARTKLLNSGLVRPGDTVTIDGSESPYSTDFEWTQTGGPTVSLAPANGKVSFTAPSPAADLMIQLRTARAGFNSMPSVLAVHVVDNPSPPLNVQATGGLHSATVSWSAPSSDGNSPLAAYRVSSSVGGTALEVPASQTSATVSGLPDGTSMTFTVVAVNMVGLVSAPSSASMTTATFGVPGAPQSVTALPGDGEVTVSWLPPSDDGGSAITGYTVSVAGGASIAATCSASPCTAVVSNLTNGISYAFTVTATNAVGTGPTSAQVSAAPLTTPGAPSSVVAVRGDQQATVSWQAPANDGGAAITSFVISSTPSGGVAQTVSCDSSVPANCSAIVTGLSNGTSYTFTVVAQNAAGNGTPSQPSNAITPAGSPGAPVIGTPVPGNSAVTVAWAAPAANGDPILDYQVSVWIAPGASACTGPSPCQDLTVPPPSTCSSSSCTQLITGLTNGVTYQFRVTARNGVGSSTPSAFSSYASPSTNPGAPTPPRNPTATGGTGSADVAWMQPVDLGTGNPSTLSYTVIESQTGTQRTSSCATTSCQLTFTGLTGGLSYTFTITASTNAGTSAGVLTNSVLVVDRPQPPTNVTVVRGDAQVTVSWTRPANDGGGAITSDAVLASPAGGTAQQESCDSATPAHCTAVVTGLSNGTSYTFTVTSTNAYGTSNPSSPSLPVTPSGVPTAPTAVSLPSRGNGFITASWTNGSSNGSALTGSTIYVYATSSGSCTTGLTLAKTVAGCTASSCSNVAVSGLTNGQAYCVKITDTNANGEGAFSAAAGPVTPATTPGSPGLTLTRGAATLNASVSAPAQNGGAPIDAYWLDLCTSGQSCTGAGTCSLGPALQSKSGGAATYTFNATACSYSAGSTTCTWNGTAVIGRAYTVCAYAHNAIGYGAATASTATPKVAWAADNISAIFGDRGCRGCHTGHTPNLNGNVSGEYSSSFSYGDLLWQCPQSGTSGNGTSCMGIQSGWGDGTAHVNALRLWVTDGKNP